VCVCVRAHAHGGMSGRASGRGNEGSGARVRVSEDIIAQVTGVSSIGA
jgi:hypothetical protein